MANPREIDTKEGALRMWAHEALRVFGDRFTSADDLARFRTIVDVSMAKNFEVYLKVIFDGLESPEAGPVFADFLTPPPPLLRRPLLMMLSRPMVRSLRSTRCAPLSRRWCKLQRHARADGHGPCLLSR